LQKSRFKNLYVGILAGDTDINGVLPYSFMVRKAIFEGCWTGIRSTAGSRAVIVQNDFKLGFLPPNISTEVSVQGLLLDDTHTAFTIEENTFVRDPNATQDVIEHGDITGILAISTGEMNKQIRKNYFTDLKVGNLAKGDNANPLGTTGLLYLCNENIGNDQADFRVDNMTSGKIRSIQALPVLNTSTLGPAGNLFSHTVPLNPNEPTDFRSQFDVFYYYSILSPQEEPIFVDPNHFYKTPLDLPRSCASSFCKPPCKSDGEIAAIKGKIEAAKSRYDSIQWLLQTGNADSATIKSSERVLSQALYEVHTLTAEVTTHIAFSYGENAEYRALMAAVDAYDTDLSLANDYVGSGDTTAYKALMDEMVAKHQLAGARLDEFNAYRTITESMAKHSAQGGTKYTLDSLQVAWLKGIADNSPHVRAKGLAQRILRLYGYYYPAAAGKGEDIKERSTVPPVAVKAQPEFFSLYPNPSHDVLNVHIEAGAESAAVWLRLINAKGEVVQEKQGDLHVSGDFVFSTQTLPAGIYWVRATLDSGKTGSKKVLIAH
jgi:hypothetical protein